MRLVGIDAQMMQLHLRLRPRQRRRALESGRVVMLVDQVERFGARRRDDGPERDPRRRSSRNAQTPAHAEDWIEHGTDGIRQRPPVDRRDRVAHVATAPEKSRTVRLELYLTD